MAMNLAESINLSVTDHSMLTAILSQYTERTITKDGTVENREIHDARFLANDIWSSSMFSDIPQFQVSSRKAGQSKVLPIKFEFPNDNLNLEAKFIIYHKIFNGEWSISNLFMNQRGYLNLLAKYINQAHPRLSSFLDLDAETDEDWCSWLADHGHSIATTQNGLRNIILRNGRGYPHKLSLALLLPNFRKCLEKHLDTREEWEKDRWDARNLGKYGVNHNKTTLTFYICFHKIKNDDMKNALKEYLKQKLINKTFAWSTAKMYADYMTIFLSFLLELEPEWNDWKKLTRGHILRYIEWLNQYVQDHLTRKGSNSDHYKNRALTIVHKFFSDLQLYKHEMAPEEDIRTLIYPEDKPKIPKKTYDKTDYIPDFVLEQLFCHINDLRPDAIPVVWVMFKTGLRISDVLLLKQDCLLKLNGKYWIESDIEKTYVKGHRIPIDDELAAIIAELIRISKEKSNEFNNSDGFIFARLSGPRKGKPLGQYLIREYLNIFAHQKNIVGEMGNRYHFTNHAFRHTYAVKLLNGGADIFTIQELLAHASPEMTMRYARLLDDNKRKAFDKVVKQGVFSFEDSSVLVEKDCSEIPDDILHMLWMNHKLEAIDTPYGTCLQRTKGKCGFAKQPPCLTCNGGNPCRDLCIGAFDGDVGKYEILIASVKAIIGQAEKYGRQSAVEENSELLTIYQNIYNTITNGNLIYGRLERLVK